MLNKQHGLKMCPNNIGHDIEKESDYKKDDKTATSTPSISNQIDLLATKSFKIRSDIENMINITLPLSTPNKKSQSYLATIDKGQEEFNEEKISTKENLEGHMDNNIISNDVLESSSLKTKLLTLIQQLQSINDELIKCLKNLNERFEQQKEFINIAAHEIRSPTQAIIGYTELLALEPQNSKKYHDLIVKNSEMLNVLVSNILDTSRIDNKTLNLKKERFDIVKLINQIVEDKSNRLNSEKEISILIRNNIFEFDEKTNDETRPPDKSKYDNSFMIYADKGRIAQVITNLLENAIRHTNSGGDIIVILSKNVPTKHHGLTDNNNKSRKDNELLIQVRDTGRGITSDVLPNLFSKFMSDPNSGRTGLGLYISKNIIEAHGGKISAKNNNDKEHNVGATFSIVLPLCTEG
ncbi:MAG TPA: HAMP domain-containing sensor histidine kinase [Candidatus Saccharimonadales bacterium]|nr:HAMP domain-containing sensor histidine kinase [Candidatus Saccharimonadales bacterium]